MFTRLFIRFVFLSSLVGCLVSTLAFTPDLPAQALSLTFYIGLMSSTVYLVIDWINHHTASPAPIRADDTFIHINHRV